MDLEAIELKGAHVEAWIKKLCQDFGLPYTGFGEYDLKLKLQDNRLFLKEMSGKASKK